MEWSEHDGRAGHGRWNGVDMMAGLVTGAYAGLAMVLQRWNGVGMMAGLVTGAYAGLAMVLQRWNGVGMMAGLVTGDGMEWTYGRAGHGSLCWTCNGPPEVEWSGHDGRAGHGRWNGVGMMAGLVMGAYAGLAMILQRWNGVGMMAGLVTGDGME